ncbi:MAG TPA: GNAT family N-acetyltransferase [Planktothrix sp.]|jgi:N-acetylglutamate synthase-like GNAT family acetyltransferase
MQIRIGNKQDESSARALIEGVLAEDSNKLDLDGADSDLKKIETHYFGHDGIFLVAEVDRQVAGIAAALKRTETVCELKRLYVGRPHRNKDIEAQLLRQIIKFAKDLDYLELAVADLENQRDLFISNGFSLRHGQLIRSL